VHKIEIVCTYRSQVCAHRALFSSLVSTELANVTGRRENILEADYVHFRPDQWRIIGQRLGLKKTGDLVAS